MEVDTSARVGARGRVCHGQGVRKVSLCPAHYIHRVAPTQDEVSVCLMITLWESRSHLMWILGIEPRLSAMLLTTKTFLKVRMTLNKNTTLD